VTATFEVGTFILSVAKDGDGAGTVTSSPAGIDCGSDCSQSYVFNTSVMLTATPVAGSVFAGWSGDCTGTGSCTVTMGQARSVTATFNDTGLDFYTLTPCRVIDTRDSTPLTSDIPRLIDVAGTCGVPFTAKVVTVNVTALMPPNTGRITLYPDDGTVPATSTINFRPSLNLANNAMMPLASNGDGTLVALAVIVGGGNVEMILDVTGYFQ
jgi:hypothetical protein